MERWLFGEVEALHVGACCSLGHTHALEQREKGGYSEEYNCQTITQNGRTGKAHSHRMSSELKGHLWWQWSPDKHVREDNWTDAEVKSTKKYCVGSDSELLGFF